MRVRQYGLTLVELLVAISILGLIAVMGWRGLDSIVRTRSALNVELEQTRGMQLAFAQLQNDSAQLTPELSIQDRPNLFALANKLTLVRNVYTEGQATRVQVISYRVVGNKLIRRASPATRNLNELDQMWLNALQDTDSNPTATLQEGVEAMAFRVWRSGSWQTSTNSPNVIAITGLEVVLTLTHEANGLIKLFLLGPV